MNLTYCIAVWAVAYAEAINEGVYLPVPDTTGDKTLKDVLATLEQTHPDVSFNYGLGDEDILHNAIATLILEKVGKVEMVLQELSNVIRPTDKISIRVGKTPPVKLGPYLRSFLRHLKPLPPNLRLGGSNGELTVLKLATGLTSVKALAKVWLRNVTTKLEFLKRFDLQITHPTPKQNLPPHNLSNEKNLLSGSSIAINLKNLTQVLLHHHNKSFLLQVGYTKKQFPDFESILEKLPGRCLRVYRSFIRLHEVSLDICVRGDDLEYLFAWDMLYDVVSDVLKILEFGAYDPKEVGSDLRSNPMILDELIAYYPGSTEARDFDGRIDFMSEWEIV